MAQADITADLAKQVGSERTAVGQVWYIIRRWPIIPVAILALLIFTGIFANFLAPHSPIVARPDDRN